MKRCMMIIFAIILFSGTAWAQPAIGSGAFTSSKVIVAVPVNLVDAGCQTDGTADVTMLVYDNASAASGKVLAFVFVPAGFKTGGWNCPVESGASSGLYASVSGTGVTRCLVSFKTK